MIPGKAFADDFSFEAKCEGSTNILSIKDQNGNNLENVKVLTIETLTGHGGYEDKFFTDENGLVSIPFSQNTGYVWIQKGGFNDQKHKLESCDENKVPNWIRQNAKWWIEGSIDEESFIQGMRYLIKENIIVIPETVSGERNTVSYEDDKKIPTWIVTNVDWWVHDVIDDNTFLQGMKFLVVNGIINLDENISPGESRIDENGNQFNYDLGNITFDQKTISNRENTSECPSDYPYRWSDGNCWNLPEDYEIQLECSQDYPYMWSNGQCYNLPECSGEYSYRWSDGQCYNAPECSGEYQYRWRDNQCYNLPECVGEFPFRWSDGQCYNMRECTGSTPYRWSDNRCYNLPECTVNYPYRWDDGQCYNMPPPARCNSGSYDTGYGYCCPDDSYTNGDGICHFIQACPDGYWENNYGYCCPDGTYDPGDGSCRYP